MQNHKGERYLGVLVCSREGAHSGSWEGGILHENILPFYTVVMNDDEEELRTHHSGYLGSL